MIHFENKSLVQSYQPEMSDQIDTEEEILADELGITIEVARKLAKWRSEQQKHVSQEEWLKFGHFIGICLNSPNIPLVLHALAFAFGLDQLNDIKSQTEVANKYGVTRQAVSHYVTGWKDLFQNGSIPESLPLDITKFCKKNDDRKTYKETHKSIFLELKRRKIEEYKLNEIPNNN